MRQQFLRRQLLGACQRLARRFQFRARRCCRVAVRHGRGVDDKERLPLTHGSTVGQALRSLAHDARHRGRHRRLVALCRQEAARHLHHLGKFARLHRDESEAGGFRLRLGESDFGGVARVVVRIVTVVISFVIVAVGLGLVVVTLRFVVVSLRAVVMAVVCVVRMARTQEHSPHEGYAEKAYFFHESCFMVLEKKENHTIKQGGPRRRRCRSVRPAKSGICFLLYIGVVRDGKNRFSTKAAQAPTQSQKGSVPAVAAGT